MKRNPGPIVSVVLLVALGAWVYFREFRGADERLKSAQARDRVVSLDRATVKAIRIQNDKGAVRVQKDGDVWSITEPLAAPADKQAVDGILASIESARIERRLGAGENRKDYHLDPPAATVTLEPAAGAGAQSIGVGDSNPIGGTCFALLPDGKEIAVVSASIGDVAKKALLDLRDKTVLAFDPWRVTRVRVERGKEALLLQKPEDGWKIQEPFEAPADGPAVNDLLSAAGGMKAASFAAEKASETDLRRFGLSPPEGRLTILQEGWDAEKSILVGRETAGGRYVKASGRDAVMVVPADFWPKLKPAAGDLRRKDLLGLSQYRVESITAGRAGKPALVLARQKDKTWKASGLSAGTVKADTVEALLRTLAELKAQSFDNHPAEALRASLARSPALDLTLQQEPDTEGGATRSQHLVIGPPDKKGVIRVRDMAWRPVASAPASSLEAINKELDAIIKEAGASAGTPAVTGAGAPAGAGGAPPGGKP